MKNRSVERIIQIVLMLAFLSVMGLPVSARQPFRNYLVWKVLPDLPPPPGETVQYGVSAPFAGVSNNVLLVAGGTNFPDKPVWEGGKKKYYSDAYALVREEGGNYKWYRGFTIPKAAAYGVSVTTERGVICIGGKNETERFSFVFLMRWNPEDRNILIDSMPSLPCAMYNMAGALVGNKIYVAGGMVDDAPSNAFYSLDLEKWGTEAFQWERLPDFPGPPRLQAVAVGQDAAEENHFYLFSGSVYSGNLDYPLLQSDGLEYDPVTQTWSPVPATVIDGDTISLHGAGGVAVSAHHVLFVGGVNRKIFGRALLRERHMQQALETGDSALYSRLRKEQYAYFTMQPDSFRFNKRVIAYHTITKTWTSIQEYPFPAPAGAPVVKWNDGWVVVNGEIKPGVRSPKVYFGKVENKIMFGAWNWTVLGIYLLGMLFIGYYFMQREKSTHDFFKAGGRIPWWAAGISIFATVLSAITYITIPAKTYATDWKYFVMAATIPLVAWPVVKYYLPFFRKLNVTTAYEYLEKRFDYTIRFIASSFFQVFMIVRMALVLFLPSLALSAVTGIDIYLCISLMGLITIAYCTMGGVEAVVWGDVIQGFVLLGGAILTIVFLISDIQGGLKTVVQITLDEHKMKMFDMAFDFRRATFWVMLLGGFVLNLIPYSSDQSVIQRYMATKDEKTSSKGIWFNGWLSIPVSFVFYFIGTALYVFFKTHPAELNLAAQNTDAIFPHFIMARIPVGVAGLMIAAIFSASMSTISANINSISTAYTMDFYQHFHPASTDRRRLNVARITGIVAGGIGILLALFMATWDLYSLFDYFNTFLGLLAGGLAGLFAMGIFFRRINAKAALFGFLFGLALLMYVKFFTMVSFLLYGFIGFSGSILFAWIFSFFYREKKQNIESLVYHR
ncbi:MAG: cyclically-permuted mutarotase family protein [Bacteroidales bacterium]|nr:cyclically-permuted mutarotase family protein [Bacteroidales bacterium]